MVRRNKIMKVREDIEVRYARDVVDESNGEEVEPPFLN